MAPDYRRSPILVLGAPRSGTSLVAGALGLLGAWLGRTVGPSPANPKGFFENRRIRETIVKPFLARIGCDPLGVSPLPDFRRLPETPELAREVLASIEGEGYSGDRPWLYKDAKLTLLWPICRRAFPGARWIIVRRRTDEIVRSCLATPFMAQHSGDPAFWERFAGEYSRRLDLLAASGVWYREVLPDRLVGGDLAPLASLAADLGLAWDQERVAEFLDRRHWHP